MTKSNLIEQLELTGEREKELSSALDGLTDRRAILYIDAFKSLQKLKFPVYNITKFIDTLNKYTFWEAENLIGAIDKNFYIPYFFYNYDWRSHNYISIIDHFDFTRDELQDISEALSNWYLLSNNTLIIMQSATPKMCTFVKQLGFGTSPLDCKRKSTFLKNYHSNIHLINTTVLWIEKLYRLYIYFLYFQISLYTLHLLKLRFEGNYIDYVSFVATLMILFLTIIISKFLIKILQHYRSSIEALIPRYAIASRRIK